MKKIDNRFLVAPLTLLLWAIFALLYFFTKANPNFHPVAGYLSLAGEASLDILAGYLAFKTYRSAQTKENKTIFYSFMLSFISAVIADAVYNMMLNLSI